MRRTAKREELDDVVPVEGRRVHEVRDDAGGGNADTIVEVEVFGAVGLGGRGADAGGVTGVRGADDAGAEDCGC
jgi:hypothetical protein